MMVAVRCFSCGKPIADKYDEFKQRVSAGEKASEVLNSLGIERYCCKRMFLSNVDLSEEIKAFPRF